MQESNKIGTVLTDGSRLIIEALARSGADAFIGYPITPANLLYLYGSQRMELMLPAPDEITTLQWMAGLAATRRLPVTATSFPGYALMLESVNMAYMMELPMVIVLVQRLGPATGTATCGAQGDLLLLRGSISGGHPLPVLGTSDFADCYALAGKAAQIAVELRTPVVLLTSKEEVMTQKSFRYDLLDDISEVAWPDYTLDCEYKSYKANNGVPEFLPVTQTRHQVRLNASTHDELGLLQHTTPQAMANTLRLEEKVLGRMQDHVYYEYDKQQEADCLVVAYGITASAAKDAVTGLRSQGRKVSLLIPKTLLPVPEVYARIIGHYSSCVMAEENINNQFGELIYGKHIPAHIRFAGSLGKMITPNEIIQEVLK